MTCTIKYSGERPPRLDELLSKGLADYAKQKKGFGPFENFSFSLQDQNQDLMGGCVGVIYYGCLYIDMLWIDEKFRHKGYGTKLMNAVQVLAKEKGCLFLTVATMDWEALDFYKKLGYQVEFERKGYLENSSFYFLRKDL